MHLKEVKLERFTAFADLGVKFSPGINVLVGANGTGKTHLMKVCYAACDVARTGDSFLEKLVQVFLPSSRAPGRLVHRKVGRRRATVEVFRGDRRLKASFSTQVRVASSPKAEVVGTKSWTDNSMKSVYIPVKEMLSNAPGFLSLYASREVHFEEVYRDILERAYLPVLRGPMDKTRSRLLANLQYAIAGRGTVRNEEFILNSKQGNFEFPLLAEGMRKLALLWLLIQNGTLQNGSVLFWDEPETNLNPKLFGMVIDVLLELQRLGVQIFFATHDYAILEELETRRSDDDKVAFHSLYRAEDKIVCNAAFNYLDLHPNTIAEAYTDLYDRVIERSLRGLGR